MSLLLQDMQEPCLSDVKKGSLRNTSATKSRIQAECFSIGRYKPHSTPEAILRKPQTNLTYLKVLFGVQLQ